MQVNLEETSRFTADIILHEYESKCNQNYGLYNGKSGLSMAYFILSFTNKNKSHRKKAQTLIEEISDNIGSVNSLNFEDGLTGIGWCIEWIGFNEYIKINTDEILESLDDELYKFIVHTPMSNTVITVAERLGIALYFHRRLLARNPGTNRYKTICTEECLTLIVNQLSDEYLEECISLFQKGDITNEDELMVCRILIFYCRMLSENFLTITCRKSIRTILPHLHRHIQGSIKELYVYYAIYVSSIKTKQTSLIPVLKEMLEDNLMKNRRGRDLSSLNFYLDKKLSAFLKKEDIYCQSPINPIINDNFSLLNFITSNISYKNVKAHNWEQAWFL